MLLLHKLYWLVAVDMVYEFMCIYDSAVLNPGTADTQSVAPAESRDCRIYSLIIIIFLFSKS